MTPATSLRTTAAVLAATSGAVVADRLGWLHVGALGALLLIGVGVAIGASQTQRPGRADLEVGPRDVRSLHRVAALVGQGGADDEEVVATVAHDVATILGLRGCRYTDIAPAEPVVEMTHDGHVPVLYVHDGEGYLLPRCGVAIAVRHGGRDLGWLVGTPLPPAAGVSHTRRRAAIVLADLLGAHLADRRAPIA